MSKVRQWKSSKQALGSTRSLETPAILFGEYEKYHSFSNGGVRSYPAASFVFGLAGELRWWRLGLGLGVNGNILNYVWDFTMAQDFRMAGPITTSYHLEVPVSFRYYQPLGKSGYQLVLEGGWIPSFGDADSSRTTFGVSEGEYVTFQRRAKRGGPGPDGVPFNLQMGLGWELPLGKRHTLTFMGHVYIGTNRTDVITLRYGQYDPLEYDSSYIGDRVAIFKDPKNFRYGSTFERIPYQYLCVLRYGFQL